MSTRLQARAERRAREAERLAALEAHRRPSGQFGQQTHSAPEGSFGRSIAQIEQDEADQALRGIRGWSAKYAAAHAMSAADRDDLRQAAALEMLTQAVEDTRRVAQREQTLAVLAEAAADPDLDERRRAVLVELAGHAALQADGRTAFIADTQRRRIEATLDAVRYQPWAREGDWEPDLRAALLAPLPPAFGDEDDIDAYRGMAGLGARRNSIQASVGQWVRFPDNPRHTTIKANALLQRDVAEFEQREGRAPTGRERRAMVSAIADTFRSSTSGLQDGWQVNDRPFSIESDLQSPDGDGLGVLDRISGAQVDVDFDAAGQQAIERRDARSGGQEHQGRQRRREEALERLDAFEFATARGRGQSVAGAGRIERARRDSGLTEQAAWTRFADATGLPPVSASRRRGDGLVAATRRVQDHPGGASGVAEAYLRGDTDTDTTEAFFAPWPDADLRERDRIAEAFAQHAGFADQLHAAAATEAARR